MARPWVRPVPVLAHPAIQLFLTSAAVLFTELALIRWIPANVVSIGFFSNFLLMGSFLGIGAGILIGRRWTSLASFAPLLLLTVVVVVTRAQLNMQVSSDDEIFFGIATATAPHSSFFVLPLVVLLTTLVLASTATPLGPLLRSMSPLKAYAVDVAGALAGIAAFAGLAAAWTTPAVWFAVLATVFALLGLGQGLGTRSLLSAVALVGVVGFSIPPPTPSVRELWSPYYRITEWQRPRITTLAVNGILHQQIVAASVVLSRKDSAYGQVYRWYPERQFANVLIVGAGSGTDTAVALAKNVGHIDAVEIDPRIARIGAELHPDHPYDDPRVHVVIDDGRHFVETREPGRYDLVVFALPDSLTLVNSSADIRLESFLFTRESFEAVRRAMTPDGVFVLYNYYRQPWLVGRIASLLEEVFGRRPLLYWSPSDALAVMGAGGPAGDRPPLEASIAALPRLPDPVDDWPFLYLKQPGVPSHYLLGLGILVVFAVVLLAAVFRGTGTPLTRASPHFFALGAAFMLLEARSLVVFSRLFGSTWLVNALASFAILASVLAAIGLNALVAFRRPRLLYGVLLATLVLAYLIPPETLVLEPAGLRYALASALAFAPIFVANLCFTRSFRDSKTADTAFASNLLGAMAGGALEYLALAIGYRALLLVVAALYALAYVAAYVRPFLADRELEA